MNEDGHSAARAPEPDTPGDRARAEPEQEGAPGGPPPQDPWLQRHKVELPDAIEGFVERPELEARCALTAHRLTVLHAPGGFGKTALLVRHCRAARDRGIPVAWLSLDEDDGPGSVATYLALAFERAGIATFDAHAAAPGPRDAPEPEADSQADYRIGLLVRALERHAAPCVLAMDELDRLRSPDAVAAINLLLRRAPRDLHVAMAFRDRPPGLDIAMFALEGRGETVTAEDLRFAKADVVRFFDRGLSRRELASVLANSAGWPIALRIYRNGRVHAAPNAGNGDDTAAGWIETRLWRGLPARDREFVLDLALFDWIDAELVDEATGARNSAHRIASIGALAGLLSTTGGKAPAMRLHPLVRDYGATRRFEEDAERFRSVHRGIALALARRARVVEALRHAGEAGDGELIGRIAERAGGVKLWLEQGLEVLRTVDGLLTAEVLSRYPRMVLVRCIALTVAGDIEAAKRVYRDGAAQTGDFTRDREGGDDRALQIDHVLVRGLLHLCGCAPYGGRIAEAIEVAERMANGPRTDPWLRGVFSLGMCIAHNQTTAFDLALDWAGRARSDLGRGSPYLAHVDFQAGSAAMAAGRTREAERCYERALKRARASHLRDAGAVMIGEALADELALERAAGAPRLDRSRVSPRLLGECSAWLDVYAANAAVGAELALLHRGPEAALALVEDAREYARLTERAALARFLSALRVEVLLAGGRVAEAERAWRFDRLPERAGECTDLETQSWREAEIVACARLRLLSARGEFDAARELAGALLAAAAERSLVRTSMRGMALSMALEHRAGRDDRVRAHLVDYLRLFAGTDYARGLARERAVALPLLDDVAGARAANDDVGAAAARLRNALRAAPDDGEDPAIRALSAREIDVLARMERQRDKEIARALGLTYDGVRYRVRCIFAKLGARGRLDAVRRAQALDILPPAADAPTTDP